MLIAAAIVTIFIVLGILYESLIHPITVLSTLPSAGVGAVLALLAFKMEFSIIALIGVFLLIGLVKKNAILIIDFALEAQRGRGISAVEAVREACLLRFRPILMTTLAAGLGALPLAIGFGEGSELRQPLGVAIIGGLIASQLLTLLTTPVVYIYLDRVRRPRKDDRRPAPLQRRRVAAGGVKEPCMTVSLEPRPCSEPCAGALTACCTVEARTTSGRRRPISANFKEAAGFSPAAPADMLDRGEWWTVFNDPVLNDLAGRVQVDNQNVIAAEAAYRQAREVVREQRAGLFPTVDVSGSATLARAAGGSSGGTVTNGSTWLGGQRRQRTLGLPGQPGRKLGARRLGSHPPDDRGSRQRPGPGQRRRSGGPPVPAQGELAADYFGLREVDVATILSRETVDSYGRSLKITQNRYNAGIAPKSDVLQAQTQLDSAQSDLAGLEQQRANFEHAIAVLTGVAPGDFSLAAVSDWKPAIVGVPPLVPSALLQRRPDIAAAERAVAAANAQIGIERSAFFPNIGLTGSYGFCFQRIGFAVLGLGQRLEPGPDGGRDPVRRRRPERTGEGRARRPRPGSGALSPDGAERLAGR